VPTPSYTKKRLLVGPNDQEAGAAADDRRDTQESRADDQRGDQRMD
jgi:hypothetical protein